MVDQINFDALGNDLLAVFGAHRLTVESFSVELTVPRQEFDRLAKIIPNISFQEYCEKAYLVVNFSGL